MLSNLVLLQRYVELDDALVPRGLDLAELDFLAEAGGDGAPHHALPGRVRVCECVSESVCGEIK